MKKLRSNRGATLLELIAAVAIFSIVGLTSFALLMFSIRTNDYIVDGADATGDSNLLNARLALFFNDKITVAETAEEGQYSVSLVPADEGSSPEQVLLTFDCAQGTLFCGEEIFCEDLSAFSLEPIAGTNLIRASYSIGEREYVKLFRLQDTPPMP